MDELGKPSKEQVLFWFTVQQKSSREDAQDERHPQVRREPSHGPCFSYTNRGRGGRESSCRNGNDTSENGLEAVENEAVIADTPADYSC